ncbi:MAG: DUF58 domain-containing protein [Gaiellales bacterium]
MTSLAFPLVPSRRGSGLEVAGRTSRRRGSGSEIASTRPYRRGDAVKLIDWAASARLSSARGSDEFVVRDHFAEDAVRVVVVVDRSPSMRLYADGLPWLQKSVAARLAATAILESAAAVNGLVGFADAGIAVAVEHPRRDPVVRRRLEELIGRGETSGPVDSVDRALAALGRRVSRVPPGTFVFVISDLFPAPSPETLRLAVAAGWDLVPVVVQDPTWERSFPEVAGVSLPIAEPATGAISLVRLTEAEIRRRREECEARLLSFRDRLDVLGLDEVVVTSHEPERVHAAFLGWAGSRVHRLRGGP